MSIEEPITHPGPAAGVTPLVPRALPSRLFSVVCVHAQPLLTANGAHRFLLVRSSITPFLDAFAPLLQTL